MSLTFYIIYTAGTVRPLQLLLHSLLKWSDCTFRLVANGCSAAEQAALRQLCASNPRLAYQTLPTKQLMLHGEALNYLQGQHQGDYFCFMDSDIYAVGEFLPSFLPSLGKYGGIFSGMPLRFRQYGLTVPKGHEFLAGPFTHTQDQLCVGSTFFAIYQQATLTEVRRTTGIGFTKYCWSEIPMVYQEQLACVGVKHQIYDTAKLLNIMLHLQGHQLYYQPCTALHHIEAVSRFAVIQQRPWWGRLRAWGGHWRRKLAGQEIKQTYDDGLPYLSQVLLALAHNRPVPAQPANSTAWVQQARAELLALHAEFAQSQGVYSDAAYL